MVGKRVLGRVRRFLLAGVLVCACVGQAGAVHAAVTDAATPLERSVKAAFLYKFLSFVEWRPGTFPDGASPIVIGVYGLDSFADELRRLVAGRPVGGRSIEIRTVRRGEAITGLHVLFVGVDESAQLPALTRSAQQHGVLVVGEGDRALPLGSSISLVVSDGRVRFDVSLSAAEKAGIRLSSRLLAVARTVRSGGE